MGLDLDTLKRLVRGVLATRPTEITCDECMQYLDRYAELEVAGRNPAQVFPAVNHHLGMCRDCHQEYQGLLAAVRGLA